MNNRPLVAILEWLPDIVHARLQAEFPELQIVDACQPAAREAHLPRADITFGLPPLAALATESKLRWIQLASAGVPLELCKSARQRQLTITNLAGLYGPTIAEHTFGLMLLLARRLHVALRQQQERRWDRTLRESMSDLHGRTLAVLGLGNIGQHVARLGRAFGMRVLGCRRTDRATPLVDRLYLLSELPAMLAEADYLVVAVPLTARTEGMLGAPEFAALKPGAVYVNVSRGGVAREDALLAALRSGQVAAAALDVFATEPLPSEHPFWTMPQLIVSPHYSGETVNQSTLPGERFIRNLRSWLEGEPLEGRVDLDRGY